jgi:ribose-phosphate pyrophosphokinase
MIKIDGKEVEFKTFPNNETLFNHNSLDAVHGWIPQQVQFKYESDWDLIKLAMLKDYLDTLNVKSADLVIYYMPYSRMDRSENGSPFTLKTIANFINRLNFPVVTVVEPHSDVTCALLDNSNPYYINYNLISAVKTKVGFDDNIDYIVFPDAGAQKRYSKMPVKKPLVGFKHRNFETGKIESLEIVGQVDKVSPRPAKAIIVDDLSSYGGTFVATADALREQGISEVYLLVAHAENSIFKGKLFEHVDKVFTTDSILTDQGKVYTSIYREQLEVFEIEKLI